MCNTEQEERFAKKKEWPYDPNVKVFIKKIILNI